MSILNVSESNPSTMGGEGSVELRLEKPENLWNKGEVEILCLSI